MAVIFVLSFVYHIRLNSASWMIRNWSSSDASCRLSRNASNTSMPQALPHVRNVFVAIHSNSGDGPLSAISCLRRSPLEWRISSYLNELYMCHVDSFGSAMLLSLIELLRIRYGGNPTSRVCIIDLISIGSVRKHAAIEEDLQAGWLDMVSKYLMEEGLPSLRLLSYMCIIELFHTKTVSRPVSVWISAPAFSTRIQRSNQIQAMTKLSNLMLKAMPAEKDHAVQEYESSIRWI